MRRFFSQPAGGDGDGRRAANLVALDDAINALARLDPRKAQVVEMRFFGGLGVEETAEVLQVSRATVLRDWSMAKAWLYRELAQQARRLPTGSAPPASSTPR